LLLRECEIHEFFCVPHGTKSADPAAPVGVLTRASVLGRSPPGPAMAEGVRRSKS
jgi:hypothetical protein